MPQRMAPLTLSWSRTAVMSRPTIATQAVGLPSEPRVTIVASFGTTIPAVRSPRNARNVPMPAVIASLRLMGIAMTIALRAPMTLRTTNSTPEMNTAPSAVCHGTPIPCTTVKEKNALSPMPGAWANG